MVPALSGLPSAASPYFARAILAGEPIKVFNHGKMKRDFTYIDDVVAGVLAVLDGPPQALNGVPPCRIYNISSNRPEDLLRYISLIEKATGKTARIEFEPMQPGDIKETCADIGPIQRDYGFQPKTAIDEGIPRFVDWYRDYYGV